MWMVAQVNLARHKVHWVGQPVAGVAAVDVHVAEAALALIEVDYEPLRAVLDIAAAMAPDAPVLHEHVFTKGVEPRPRAPSNVCSRVVIARGDTARALGEAAATAQASVKVDTAHQGYLEPQVVVAQVDANGFATVWASTQGQFTAELMIARMLGLPQSKLRVVPLEIGGGFGGKIAIHGEAVAVRLAQKCRRPVKLVFTREEVLQGGCGPRRRGADRHHRRRRQGWPPRRHRRHLSPGRRRPAGLEPLARHAGLGRALPVPQSQSAGLRHRHQQAAHRGLSRARRHPGLFRHGAGDGRAVPAARHGPARVPQAQRLRHRQHHADRHAVPVDRSDHHPRAGGRAPLLDGPAAQDRRRPLSRAGAAWRSATGAARP